jgi:hypothetical protein
MRPSKATHRREASKTSPHRVEDYVCPEPLRRLFDYLYEILLAVIYGDLGAQGEGEFGSLLVLAPAQEDVEEVQGCSLDLHYDLPRFRRRVFDLLQFQGLFRIPKLAYPPGSHRLLPWASFVGPELTTARRRAGW